METGNGDDDAKLDIESQEDKQAQLRQIDAMQFDQDAFDDIQRDFTEFINSIVDINNLKKFRNEYQAIYKALVTSHKNEGTYINECRNQINNIWETGQNVKVAIRQANNECDKIAELKKKVEEETNRVAAAKEESEEKQAIIVALNADIAALERRQNEHHELEEDIKLRHLQGEKAKLDKQREEQLQKQFLLRQRESQLQQERNDMEAKIRSNNEQIENYLKQIRDTKEKKERIENEKVELERQTNDLREEKALTHTQIDDHKTSIRDVQKEIETERHKLGEQEVELDEIKATLLKLKHDIEEAKKIRNKAVNDEKIKIANRDSLEENKQKMAFEKKQVDQELVKLKKKAQALEQKSLEKTIEKEENQRVNADLIEDEATSERWH